MSGACYPDSLIGSIPNLYYYAANNPSEATIAKRRSYANTISYLTPPAENAGLYKGLKVGPLLRCWFFLPVAQRVLSASTAVVLVISYAPAHIFSFQCLMLPVRASHLVRVWAAPCCCAGVVCGVQHDPSACQVMTSSAFVEGSECFRML